jgi:glycosyltransferase involved in cell wall biosynthesis
VRAVVLTHGDPGALTGGSLVHARIAQASSRLGVEVRIRPLRRVDDPVALVADADVVVVDSIVAARVRRAALGRPLVASVHQVPGGLVDSWPARLARAALDLRCYRGADAVVVPSAYLAATLSRAGVARRRIHVIAPGCDVVGAATDARPHGRTVSFVCVANLSAHKRPLDLLDAFAMVSDLDVSLTLVGGAPNPDVAARVVERLSRPELASRARWVGAMPPDRVAKAIAASDVFVLPALHESYGMAVAEAMRAGLPAIVARSGNLPSLVRDGVEGFVVPPRDVGALAAGMRRLATNALLRSRMSAAAVRRAGSFPTWDETAQRVRAVLFAVQGRASGATASVSSAAS